MATVYVSMGAVGAMGASGIQTSVFHGHQLRSETITSSGTSAVGSLTAEKSQFVKISCATAIYANTGSSPTASATTGLYIEGGVPAYLALEAGDSVAVIDA